MARTITMILTALVISTGSIFSAETNLIFSSYTEEETERMERKFQSLLDTGLMSPTVDTDIVDFCIVEVNGDPRLYCMNAAVSFDNSQKIVDFWELNKDTRLSAESYTLMRDLERMFFKVDRADFSNEQSWRIFVQKQLHIQAEDGIKNIMPRSFNQMSRDGKDKETAVFFLILTKQGRVHRVGFFLEHGKVRRVD